MGGRKKIVRDAAFLILGCLLYSASIALFLDPNSLAPGGVTGIAIITNKLFGLSTGLVILCLNIPLLLLGIYKFGLRFFIGTILVTLSSSLLVDLLVPLGAITSDPILAALAGGAAMGVGTGLIYKARATTGGIDIVVRLIKLKLRHLKTGRIFFMADAVVVTAAAIFFKNIELALYAGVATFVTSYLFDMVLYGADGARMIYIVSKNERAIAEQMMRELDTGVTYLNGVGAYTGHPKQVIFCVVRKQQLPRVQEIVNAHDDEAFMIVSSANEVFGEGYKDPFAEQL